jgi:hypothetical protein
MSRKRYTPEEIIGKLREAEVRLSQGEKIGVICRALGLSIRPHSSLGYRPPAPVTILPPMAKSPYPQTVRALS